MVDGPMHRGREGGREEVERERSRERERDRDRATEIEKAHWHPFPVAPNHALLCRVVRVFAGVA